MGLSSTRVAELKKIAEKVAHCRKCVLYKKATKAVPGAGNPEAEIMFIGEAPGFYEDQQGLPFVGAAGKLLDKALAEIDLKREEVFIGNMIKHRPPGNRDPMPEELEACGEYIDAQIQIIKPKIIATLGRFSMGKFIKDAKISQIHGQPRWVDWQEKRWLVMPMYHPAAALRNGRVMEQFREDFRKLPQILEILKNPRVKGLISDESSQDKSDREQLSLI